MCVNTHTVMRVLYTSFFVAILRNLMSESGLEKCIHAFISSRIDYGNALLTGIPKKTVKQLQTIQNAAARVLTRTKRI